jgi:hypothetical protein
MRTFVIAALNIVMPVPHNQQRYINLLKKAFDARRSVPMWGEYRAGLGECNVDVHDEHTIVTGEIYKFFDLNAESQWFNALEQRPAEQNEREQVKIPKHLKPDYKSFTYIFFPRDHRLFFICREQRASLSPTMARKFFDDLFFQDDLIKEYGRIEVIVEPSHESLSKILSIHTLKRLYIEISPPNSDVLHDAEQNLMAKMNRQRATKMTTELVSNNPEGLNPDKETKTLAQIARSNGKVEGRGQDADGKSVSLSTADHPLRDTVKYDPVSELRSETFFQRAQQLLYRIITNQ